VLAAIRVPHVVIAPNLLHLTKLTPDKTLYVNCHTSGYDPATAAHIAAFVEAGGQMITTDWVLNTLLEKAFPNMLKYGGQSTTDGAVKITNRSDEDDEVLKGFKGEEIWRLCGGAHPITIVNKEKVKVLISSEELAQRYQGDGAILVRFEHGLGVVYHMISHFALQHNKTSTPSSSSSTPSPSPAPAAAAAAAATSQYDSIFEFANQTESKSKAKLANYVQGKGARAETVAQFQQLEQENTNLWNYDNVQNACTSSEFVMRSVLKQKKKFEKKP